MKFKEEIMVLPWSTVGYVQNNTGEPAFSGTYYKKEYVDELKNLLKEVKDILALVEHEYDNCAGQPEWDGEDYNEDECNCIKRKANELYFKIKEALNDRE